ncbi:MAG TPA: AEC family transporter [bacterium]|nr:AEC family transporter [bacterium]
MIQNVLFAVNIVAPVFLIVALGAWLKRRKLIDGHFLALSSRLVFHVTLPALLFVKISVTDLHHVFNVRLVLFTYAAILFAFAIAWFSGTLWAADGRDRGAFIQGSFRGNFAILGFAMIQSAFGPEPLANAAVLLSFMMPPYNLLAVIALTVTQRSERKMTVCQTLKEIATNPLILATAAAIPFSLFKIPIPRIFFTAAEQLASITLPMALIGIGGSLTFSGIKQDFRLSAIASFLKLILTPILVMLAAVRMDFSLYERASLFFFFASPTAIASYIMAEAMGSNGRLAGNIILLSTLASSITIASGIVLLKTSGYF